MALTALALLWVWTGKLLCKVRMGSSCKDEDMVILAIFDTWHRHV